MLRKHQLRQEHAAAMKMIQDLENRQTVVQQKFIEMEAEIFKMKLELERKIEDDAQQFAELQTQIMNLMQSQFPQGKCSQTHSEPR
jgi:vacuolar-type H+-ATPase subunit D/Vma8